MKKEFLKSESSQIAITDPRQTNTRHEKPQTGRHKTQQTLGFNKEKI